MANHVKIMMFVRRVRDSQSLTEVKFLKDCIPKDVHIFKFYFLNFINFKSVFGTGIQ